MNRNERTVGNVGKIGQAGRLRLIRPGNHANAGRRGRRPLRVVRVGRCQHNAAVVRHPGRVRRICPARPIAPASPPVRQPRVHNPTHPIPRAQPAHHFIRANQRRPSSHAGRAWKPAPTVGIRISPTLVPTPQSRRKAPRQLPFQGSQGVGEGLRRLRNCLPRCPAWRLQFAGAVLQ